MVEKVLPVKFQEMCKLQNHSRNSKAPSQIESPIVPSVNKSYSQNSSGSEENPSADDEGSRDGDDAKLMSPESSCNANSVDCTPRTKKKVEHFRQGLAARRIQRTWKHFYEELEERKDVRNELPAPLVQGKLRHPYGTDSSLMHYVIRHHYYSVMIQYP